MLSKAGLAGLSGDVALVLDASGSMFRLYQQGTVARVVERLAAVAGRLDEDGRLDVWAYATNPLQLPSLRVADMAEWIPLYVRTKSANTGAGGGSAAGRGHPGDQIGGGDESLRRHAVGQHPAPPSPSRSTMVTSAPS